MGWGKGIKKRFHHTVARHTASSNSMGETAYIASESRETRKQRKSGFNWTEISLQGRDGRPLGLAASVPSVQWSKEGHTLSVEAVIFHSIVTKSSDFSTQWNRSLKGSFCSSMQ